MRRIAALPIFVAMVALGAGCPVWGPEHDDSNDPPRDDPPANPDPVDPDPDPDPDPVDPDCRTHGDCAALYYCTGAALVCTISSACTTDTDCEGGFICDFRHTCVPTVAGACRSDLDCSTAGEVCVEGQCRNTEDLCQFSYQCGANKACMNNACVSICGGAADCGSGTSCQGGFCRPVDQCDTSATCGAGSHCVEGRCLPDCRDSGTCSLAGDVCAEDEFCRPDWETHAICDVDVDCEEGHVCRDGYCRTPCEGGTNQECLAFDHQLPICASDNLCYSENETSPECGIRAECEGGDDCIDAICR